MSHTHSLLVNTPGGCIPIPVSRSEAEETVTLSAELQGQSLTFREESTEAALVQLARYLPQGWTLRACISCCHGNFCPVGDNDNELFCVADFEPQSKADLFEVTEAPEQRDRRRRTLFHYCDRYAPQREDYFTYNDFAHKLGR